MTEPGAGFDAEFDAEQLVARRRASSLRRGLIAAVAVLLAAALVLTACTPLLRLIDAPRPAPKLPEVTGVDFGGQRPDWQDCGDGLRCALVNAPLDWSEPAGERIQLALVKKPARAARPLGTLFVNPGGPGASGVDFVAGSVDYAIGSALRQSYDVIGWDPRGVGNSSAVSCLDAAGMDEMLFGLGETEGLETGSDEWIAAGARESAQFARACLDATGPLFGHVDTDSTVKDLEMLREIVGDPKLNFLGYSYGTFIGALYAEAFPERVGRLVLDGAIDPATSLADVVQAQTLGFEASLRAYVADCLGRAGCPLSGGVEGGMRQWRALLDRVEVQPLTGADGRPVGSGTLLTAIITPLYSQGMWGYLDQLYTSVSKGDAETALALADLYHRRENGVYRSNMTEAFMAINCLDYPRELPLDVERMRREAAELDRIAPTIGAFQGYGDIGCSQWPVPAVDTRGPVSARGADPILVVGTTGDPSTPFKWAEALAAQLQSGVLLVYEGEGHTAYGGNACIDAAVEKYLLTGQTPANGTRCS